MPAEPELNDATLKALCDTLGATDSGLTGSEIGRYLRECCIDDPEPTITKRHRLLRRSISGRIATAALQAHHAVLEPRFDKSRWDRLEFGMPKKKHGRPRVEYLIRSIEV